LQKNKPWTEKWASRVLGTLQLVSQKETK